MKRKYVVTKAGKARIAPTSGPNGYHKKLVKDGRNVKSAGRFSVGKSGGIKTYSKSWSFDKHPARGDAAKIRARLER